MEENDGRGCAGCFGIIFFGSFFLLMAYGIYQVIIGFAPLFK